MAATLFAPGITHILVHDLVTDLEWPLTLDDGSNQGTILLRSILGAVAIGNIPRMRQIREVLQINFGHDDEDIADAIRWALAGSKYNYEDHWHGRFQSQNPQIINPCPAPVSDMPEA